MRYLLERAMRMKKPIIIIYMASSGIVSKRTIRVYKIKQQHIIAFCFVKNQYRTFVTTHILAVEPSMIRRLNLQHDSA